MKLKYVGRCQQGDYAPKYGHEYEVISMAPSNNVLEYSRDNSKEIIISYIQNGVRVDITHTSIEELCNCWEATNIDTIPPEIKVHSKIVRDNIPVKIAWNGDLPKFKLINDKDIILYMLEKKLEEEVKEYQQSHSLEELADIFEVMIGILYHKGISMDEFYKIRDDKYNSNGGYEKGTFLINTASNNKILL